MTIKLPFIALILASLLFTGGALARSSTQPETGSKAADARPPDSPPQANPQLQRILDAMDKASTYGHPDLFGQFAGMHRLYDGDYDGAMKYFKIGAYNADKLSQLSIGMLYLHGRGVDRNYVAACAWITLAAERGFPSYVNARDKICAVLSPAKRSQSTALLNTLLPEYGDDVAKPRMKLALRAARNGLTGSHLGHDAHVQVASTEFGQVNCNGDRLSLGGVVVPRRGCGEYQEDLYDADKYFAARDAQWVGTVTVGELKPQEEHSASSDRALKPAEGKH